MNAARTTTAAKLADPVEVFTARCEARAYLWAEGEISDLNQAVDDLQAAMTVAFRAVREPCVVKTFDVVPDPPPDPPKRSAVPEATLDAAEYLVRQGDTERLRRWLATHDATTRIAIQKHLGAK